MNKPRLNRAAFLYGAAALPFLPLLGDKGAHAAKSTASGAQRFPRGAVRITGGVFAEAMATNKAYLLHLDPDRLLSHFRKNAGLEPKGKPYGGWDQDGASTVGNYLSACSMTYAGTGDPALKKKIDYTIAELAACQNADPKGGLYPFAWEKNDYFAKMWQGELITPPVTGWYLLHRLLAGLRDAATNGQSAEAKTILLRLSDWAIAVTAKLTPDQWQTMLGSEHGGPHEVFADVYAMTSDAKYLRLAEKFKHQSVFDPLRAGNADVLNGLHANTQIPKFVGYERIAQVSGDKIWHEAAQHFFDNVTAERSWANGGNSQWEVFFPPESIEEKVVQPCGPETCNTYNLLKLGTLLFERTPEARYMDYHERALYNHILPAFARDTEGGFVYYSSQRPAHYRVFSRPEDAFWCCVGTGMENPAKYGEMIYAHSGADKLYVNLFIPSGLEWKSRGVRLTQDTPFPAQGETTLVIDAADKPASWQLAIRHPEWVASKSLRIMVNGKSVAAQTGADGYATVSRIWRKGDRVTVALPVRITAEPLPGSARYVAFRYGPILLAGKMGAGELTRDDFFSGGPNAVMTGAPQLAKNTVPTYTAPVVVGSIETAATNVAPVPGKPLRFTLTGLSTGKAVTLAPEYDVFYERYSTYFRIADRATAESLQRKVEAANKDADTLTERTVDHVRPGDKESETNHNLVAEKSNFGGSGNTDSSRWRDATGFFRYTMAVKPDAPMGVRCIYWGGDTGRTFDVLVNGTVVGTEKMIGAEPGDSIAVTYPIPAAETRGKKSVTVEFRPKAGSVAGGVFDVRTVRII